jgi:hypothetical protein
MSPDIPEKQSKYAIVITKPNLSQPKVGASKRGAESAENSKYVTQLQFLLNRSKNGWYEKLFSRKAAKSQRKHKKE